MGYPVLHESTTQHAKYAAENLKHSSTNLNRDQYKHSFHILTNKTQQLKDIKTHYILGTNSHMFRHQGALFREFIKIRIVSPTHTSGASSPHIN